MSKWLRDIYRGNLADEDLGILWNRNACKLSDYVSRLSNDLSVYGAGLCKDNLADFIQFFVI